MSAHNPIGSCCSRPRFNVVGGIDDHASTSKLNDDSFVERICKIDRTTAMIVVTSILAALALCSAGALLLLAD